MRRIFKHLYIGALLLGTTALASCASDYLDTTPTQSVNEDHVWTTTEMGQKALNGIAKIMVTQHAFYGQGFAGENAIMRLYENLPSQNYNYNYYASGWAPIHNQTFHYRADSKYDAYGWNYYYQIIGSANQIIAKIDKAQGTDAEKKFIKAAALTFRAYAYEKLIRYYCYRWQDSNNGASRGLPLRLGEETDNLAASTLAETYAQVYTDCQEAITLFTSSGLKRESGEVWMPNINVAHAVYARAALAKQDYATALAQAKLARDNYALMSNAAYASGFCKPTSEWIFGSYGASSEQLWYWAYGVQGACNGNHTTENPTGAGTIGHELIKRIPNNDARKQLFITEDKFTTIDITDAEQVDQTFGIINTDTAFLATQVDSILKVHSVEGLSKPYPNGIVYLDGHLKFWVIDQPGVSYLPFIRSSEMVLIEAEANYFLGNTADAQAALVTLNATSGRNAAYTCTKTGDDLLNEIKDYRELELWGEGFAWSDYKRWNQPVVRHSFAEGGNAHISVAITVPVEAANKWTWVFPNSETEHNKSVTMTE